MSRTWTIDYSKIRPGMPPGRYALAMQRFNQRRRRAALAAGVGTTEGEVGDAEGTDVSDDQPALQKQP